MNRLVRASAPAQPPTPRGARVPLTRSPAVTSFLHERLRDNRVMPSPWQRGGVRTGATRRRRWTLRLRFRPRRTFQSSSSDSPSSAVPAVKPMAVSLGINAGSVQSQPSTPLIDASPTPLLSQLARSSRQTHMQPLRMARMCMGSRQVDHRSHAGPSIRHRAAVVPTLPQYDFAPLDRSRYQAVRLGKASRCHQCLISVLVHTFRPRVPRCFT